MDPVTWIYLIVMLIVLIASVALMPKPKSAPPPALGDYQVPTADDGRDVGMIFGTVWIDDPNIINYGQLTTRPIYATSGK